MKKFGKLAVIAALVLALACFVSCSNSSSDNTGGGTTEVTVGKTYTAKLGKNISGWKNKGTVLGTVTINTSTTMTATSVVEGFTSGSGTYNSSNGTWICGGSTGTYSIDGDIIWLTPNI